MVRRLTATLALALLVTLGTVLPAQAAGTISSFSKTSTGSITFTVSDITNSALPGSQAYGFSLTVQTGSTKGSVTVTAPTITGTSGNKIPPAAFYATCTETSDTNNIFTSLGMVQLSSSAVSCGQIASNSTGTVKFNVSLFLDGAAGSANEFTADTYSSGTLSVIANAP